MFSGRREPGSCCLSCEAALRTRFVSSFGALVGSRPLAVRQFQTQPVADEEPNPERFSERRCCAGSGGTHHPKLGAAERRTTLLVTRG